MTTLTPSMIQKYLKADLFEEIFGKMNMTPEEKARFLEAFGAVLQQRITYRLMQELSTEAQSKLSEILEKTPNDDVAIAQLLGAAVPNLPKIAEEEVAQYKKDLISRAKA